jgi:hypothetical protein
MDDPQMPNIPHAQWLAIAQAAVAVAVAAGAPISNDLSIAILALATAIAVVLPVSDAKIREARNKRLSIRYVEDDNA